MNFFIFFSFLYSVIRFSRCLDSFLTLEDYVEIIESHTFFEFWYFKIPSKLGLFSSFSKDSGLLIIQKAFPIDYNDPVQNYNTNENRTQEILNSTFPYIGIQIYDGLYVDSFNLFFRSINASTQLDFSSDFGYLKYNTTLTFGLENSTSLQCQANLALFFYDSLYKIPFNRNDQNLSNLALYANFESPDCQFSMESKFASMDSLVSPHAKFKYLILSAIFGIINITGGLIAAHKFKNHPRQSLRVTSFTIVVLVIYDFLIAGVLLIIRQLTNSFWEWISLMTFPYMAFFVDFVVFINHEMSLTFVTNPLHRDIACKEYAGILMCCIMTVFLLAVALLSLSAKATLLFCFALYAFHPLPQIIYNFSYNKSFRFNFWTWGLIGLSKFFLIFYVKLDPNNIFRISPDELYPLVTVILILIQWLILFTQSKFPTLGLKFSKKERRLGDDMCPICLEDLDKNAEDVMLREIIKTPCGHFFHVKCLRNCVSVTEKCPMCRADIPDFWECSQSSVYDDDEYLEI